MDIFLLILLSVLSGSLMWYFTMLIVHPYSPIFKINKFKNMDYDLVLKNTTIIGLIVGAVSAFLYGTIVGGG